MKTTYALDLPTIRSLEKLLRLEPQAAERWFAAVRAQRRGKLSTRQGSRFE